MGVLAWRQPESPCGPLLLSSGLKTSQLLLHTQTHTHTRVVSEYKELSLFCVLKLTKLI